jgi:hypothetical protein
LKLTVISTRKEKRFVLSQNGESELEDDSRAVGEEAVHDVGGGLVGNDADEEGQKPEEKSN